MLEIVFQDLELSTFNALPVPMLRQVYVKPRKGASGALSGPSGASLEFSWGHLGPIVGFKNGDFAWEVCKKW